MEETSIFEINERYLISAKLQIKHNSPATGGLAVYKYMSDG